MHDLIIIGGGPAGVASGIYASRKLLKTVLIATEIGGQSVVSDGIENWVGSEKIRGADLAKSFRSHLDAVKGTTLEIITGDSVKSLEKIDGGFSVITQSGNTFSTKAVIIASGAGRRKLTIPGAKEFENKGVTYCASCDGPLFSGKDVAVIGGGNAGFETASQLLAYAKSVTLLHRHKDFKADSTTVEKVCTHSNMHIIRHVEISEIKGNQFVTELTYKDKDTGSLKELKVSGIFVEIGVLPNTDFVKDILTLDTFGRIPVDPRTQSTNIEGVWAAGDCTDELYHQNNIAAGDGVKAAEDSYLWIKKQ